MEKCVALSFVKGLYVYDNSKTKLLSQSEKEKN